jgi:hypothetical protein
MYYESLWLKMVDENTLHQSFVSGLIELILFMQNYVRVLHHSPYENIGL